MIWLTISQSAPPRLHPTHLDQHKAGEVRGGWHLGTSFYAESLF